MAPEAVLKADLVLLESLVENCVKAIVDNPDAVRLCMIQRSSSIRMTIYVDQKDYALALGRGGANLNLIREIVFNAKAAAFRRSGHPLSITLELEGHEPDNPHKTTGVDDEMANLEELVAVCARSTVDNPDGIRLHVNRGNASMVITIEAYKDDYRFLMGAGGYNLDLIRKLLSIAKLATRRRAGCRIMVVLELKDERF